MVCQVHLFYSFKAKKAINVHKCIAISCNTLKTKEQVNYSYLKIRYNNIIYPFEDTLGVLLMIEISYWLHAEHNKS